ncbi:MAG: sigma-70 family RNA polymerase sigma factor [Proteobacteria bacterium]|jgi:RNA polymerase sigma factor (sigma-70 family)|nr:sigma-70 family RNA polymerase sigma factor [Pseudomonadota bacterium]MDA1300984.1 sigma-70 family RNA polymerase sigma factor [Pseudomonadota bacterium]
MEQADDDELMSRYAGGDTDAFDALYQRHNGPVYRYCLRQLPRVAAEEAFQDTWLAVVRFRDRYEPRGQFRAWLFTLAHNAMANRVRAEMKHPGGGDHPDIEVTEEPQYASEHAARLNQLIACLPWQQRDALMLQYEGGFSIDDIAEITASTKEGVRSRLRYAIGKLREQMSGGLKQ